MKEIVGSSLEEGDEIGSVAIGCAVFVGVAVGVLVGIASAVPVIWLESCAMVVPTMEVLIAFKSCVGAGGVAPRLQPASNRLALIKMGAMYRIDF